MEKTGNTKPNLVTYGIKIKRVYHINVYPYQTEDGQWVWSQAILPPGVLDYPSILTALIRLRYSDDQVEALVNNKLSGDKEIEFKIFQSYREECRRLTNQVLDYAREKGYIYEE